MKTIVSFLLLIILFSRSVNAQVTNTSYRTKTGERVLQLSIVVPLNRQAAWQLFTTDSGLVKWIAPLAHIELKTGGFILTNYNKEASLTDSTSIRLGIINYLEKEMLTLKVKHNNNFPNQAQEEDGNLQEVLRFEDAGKGKTKIISSMIGWGQGAHWDKTYDFFERGNAWTFQQVLKLF